LTLRPIIHKGIFKINEITLFPCFTFILKTGDNFLMYDQMMGERWFTDVREYNDDEKFHEIRRLIYGGRNKR